MNRFLRIKFLHADLFAFIWFQKRPFGLVFNLFAYAIIQLIFPG